MVAAVDLGYGAVLRKASKYLSRINDGFNVKDIIQFTRIVNSSPTKRNEWKKEILLKINRYKYIPLVLESEPKNDTI